MMRDSAVDIPSMYQNKTPM